MITGVEREREPDQVLIFLLTIRRSDALTYMSFSLESWRKRQSYIQLKAKMCLIYSYKSATTTSDSIIVIKL